MVDKMKGWEITDTAASASPPLAGESRDAATAKAENDDGDAAVGNFFAMVAREQERLPDAAAPGGSPAAAAQEERELEVLNLDCGAWTGATPKKLLQEWAKKRCGKVRQRCGWRRGGASQSR